MGVETELSSTELRGQLHNEICDHYIKTIWFGNINTDETNEDEICQLCAEVFQINGHDTTLSRPPAGTRHAEVRANKKRWLVKLSRCYDILD